MRGARQPDEARSFIDWVGEEEALLLVLNQSYRLPARQDLPAEKLPEWARDALSGIRPAELDWDLLEQHSTEWMARWDREVRGRCESM